MGGVHCRGGCTGLLDDLSETHPYLEAESQRREGWGEGGRGGERREKGGDKIKTGIYTGREKAATLVMGNDTCFRSLTIDSLMHNNNGHYNMHSALMQLAHLSDDHFDLRVSEDPLHCPGILVLLSIPAIYHDV